MEREAKESKNKKQSRKRKINIKSIVVLLFAITGIIYLVYTVYMLVIEPTNIFTIEEGSLYQQETSIGYVIRDEVVVQGENYKNGIDPIKSEGEKASKNEQIFRYYSDNEENLEKKIEELDIKIQESMINELDIYSADMKQKDDEIENKISQTIGLTNISEIEEYKKEIDKLILEKAKIAGDLSPSGTYLNQLIEERKTYETQLNSGSEYVVAPISGIVSYKVDGYEEMLTPDNLNQLTIEYLEDLKINTGQIIISSNEKAKLIDNFTYYIATVSSSEEALKAEVGDKVKARLAEGKEVGAEIVHISNEEGERLIVLELDEAIEELINYRKITFDLIWWKDSGLKVPNEAIVYKEELAYIIRNRAGYLAELLVKVERKGDRYSIVEPYSNEELEELGYTTTEIINYRKITIYDEVLLNPNLEKIE